MTIAVDLGSPVNSRAMATLLAGNRRRSIKRLLRAHSERPVELDWRRINPQSERYLLACRKGSWKDLDGTALGT